MRRFTQRYDHDLAEEMRILALKKHAIFKNLPQWRQELARAKASAKRRPTAEVLRQRRAREEVESQAAETVRRCLSALQQAVDAVNETPAPSQYQSSVSLHGMVNVIHCLRTKCGVVISEPIQASAPESESEP